MTAPQSGAANSREVGSLDGQGAGDHDQPYCFDWRPRTSAPYPFNPRQYARLLILRGRLRDELGPQTDFSADD